MSNDLDIFLMQVESLNSKIERANTKIDQLFESHNETSIKLHEYVASDTTQTVVMSNTLKELSNTLIKNTESLSEHMKRTEMNEISIEKLHQLSEKIDGRLYEVEVSEIKKEAQAEFMFKVGKLIGAVAAIAGIATSVYAFFY